MGEQLNLNPEPEGFRTNTNIKPRAKTVTITPQKAERYLKNNLVNRNVSPTAVARYARDMKAGRWDLNGEPIIIDNEGRLLDGQHRLYACIKAESSFETLMVVGLPISAMKNINTGAGRTFAHRLQLHGKRKYSTAISAVTKGLHNYHYGDQGKASNEELHDFLTANEDEIVYCVGLVQGLRNDNSSGFTATALTVSHFLFRQRAKKPADEFIEAVITGDSVSRGQPAYTIRLKMNKLLSSGAHLPMTLQVSILIRAWNAFRQNRSLGRVYTQGKDGEIKWRALKIAK